MNGTAKVAVEQLTSLLQLYEEVPINNQASRMSWSRKNPSLETRLRAAIDRLNPGINQYTLALQNAAGLYDVAQVALALKNDYEVGYLSGVAELIHADMFSDFLEAAEHLLEQGFKDPAAVMIGGVLENHLRQLCTKNVIVVDVAKSNGGMEPKKSETLNTELRTLGVYDANRQKQVTSMLALRNSAAHAKYNEYDHARVVLYASEVRNFISSFPA